MPKPYTKKEVVYYLSAETTEDDKKIREFKQDLYRTYKNVSITPNGLYESRVICFN